MTEAPQRAIDTIPELDLDEARMKLSRFMGELQAQLDAGDYAAASAVSGSAIIGLAQLQRAVERRAAQPQRLLTDAEFLGTPDAAALPIEDQLERIAEVLQAVALCITNTPPRPPHEEMHAALVAREVADHLLRVLTRRPPSEVSLLGDVGDWLRATEHVGGAIHLGSLGFLWLTGVGSLNTTLRTGKVETAADCAEWLTGVLARMTLQLKKLAAPAQGAA